MAGSFRSSRKYEIFDEDVANIDAHINVDAVEISELRSSSRNPCVRSSHDFDDDLVRKILSHAGCKPVYYSGDQYKHVPPCNNITQLSDVTEHLRVMNLHSRKKFR